MPGGLHGAFRRRLGDRERQPGIPARRPVCCIKFAIALQVQISLHLSNRKNVSDLGTDSENPGLERSQNRVLTGIGSHLQIGIADEAYEKLF